MLEKIKFSIDGFEKRTIHNQLASFHEKVQRIPRPSPETLMKINDLQSKYKRKAFYNNGRQ
jgi:hypothetical protein